MAQTLQKVAQTRHNVAQTLHSVAHDKHCQYRDNPLFVYVEDRVRSFSYLCKEIMETIVNKVAESGIITLDLVNYLAKDEEVMLFDLKPFLFREMILREKDYRAALQTHDWSPYANKQVAIQCSVDAIIPVWAYMLAASYLQPVAAGVYFGSVEELKKEILLKRIAAIDTAEYIDKRVVIKGCGETPIPEAAYVAITHHLRPVVKSVMYGEPCSTVPIYKKPAAPKTT